MDDSIFDIISILDGDLNEESEDFINNWELKQEYEIHYFESANTILSYVLKYDEWDDCEAECEKEKEEEIEEYFEFDIETLNNDIVVKKRKKSRSPPFNKYKK